MGQPTIPDHEITSPRRYLDDGMACNIDRDVEHGTGMFLQIAIEISED